VRNTHGLFLFKSLFSTNSLKMGITILLAWLVKRGPIKVRSFLESLNPFLRTLQM